ncbi:glycosyltransferase family 2 protein [Paractinoplanes toevensis]|uniref:Succinoglycan biosynthesis protein ExoA n=1 Tax=Paractinoplanes toevensis TaxID=571911 RepID=A0A919W626_9ACTN|nr:glycosyltransferase family 2 protein [Actinoplanes toevensis]GIM92253.1 succinoglycan biosynthesis protein ExoA [Actinoplanes toevensis]
MTRLPFLSVVIPCWNEAGFVAAFLDSVLANDYPADRFEILLVDGMSDDGTREIVRKYAETEPRLRLIDNPGHSKPVALNQGILESRGDVVIRLDVHASYQNDYLRRCVQGLMAHPDADNVGGIRRAQPRDDNLISRAISLANTHPLAAGNAKYRIGAAGPRWVDTVFGGCYRKEVFDRIGLFDERLDRTQDLEFNQRLRASGGKILLIPDIVCTYYPRGDWREFVEWTYRSAYWAFRGSRIVGRWIGSWRNCVPLGFVVGLAGAAALGPHSKLVRQVAGTVLGTYGGIVLAASARVASRERDPRLLVAMPVVFFATHVAYGVGSAVGILERP